MGKLQNEKGLDIENVSCLCADPGNDCVGCSIKKRSGVEMKDMGHEKGMGSRAALTSPRLPPSPVMFVHT